MISSHIEERKRRALAVPIKTILEAEGFVPLHGKGNRYISPFREEKDGSFYIYPDKNIWKDYGSMENHNGGDVINLIEKLKGVSFTMAVDYILTRFVGGASGYSSLYPAQAIKTESFHSNQVTHEILSVRHLTHPALVSYIHSRDIKIEVARRYCSEVYYKHISSRRSFFGIGFPNDNKGWVIRTAPYESKPKGEKLDIIASGISTIRRNKNQVDKSSYVFEGFFNFLSWVMLYGEPNHDVIVLNSSVNAPMLDHIAETGVRELLCYLDNDGNGEKALNRIRQCSGCEIYDDAFYAGSDKNDLNDFLQYYMQPTHTQ